MSRFGFVSVKSAPGVTTSVLAIAACWPADRQLLVVEADPAGGDLAGWYRLSSDPGLVSAATAARHGPLSAAGLVECAQTLPGGLPVVVAPTVGDQARAALRMLPAAFTDRTEGSPDLLFDLGRLDEPGTKSLLPLVDVTVLVARPRVAELSRVAAAMPALTAACPQLRLLLVGDGPYTAAEVADTLGVGVVGQLPADPTGARLLAGESGSDRRLRHTPLLRAARPIATRLVRDAAADEPAPTLAVPIAPSSETPTPAAAMVVTR